MKVASRYCGYEPGQSVDILYFKDGSGYFVSGYKVLNPDSLIASAKGYVKRTLKKRQIARLSDHVPVCYESSERCVVYHKSRLRKHKEDALSFSDVFGTAEGTGTILAGVTFDEADDLSLGLDADLGTNSDED